MPERIDGGVMYKGEVKEKGPLCENMRGQKDGLLMVLCVWILIDELICLDYVFDLCKFEGRFSVSRSVYL